MSTPAATATTITTGSSVLPWITRGLEGLWLSAVLLVPLIFLGQDYAISEAQVAYVEVPKVALLRGLAGLIVVLWSLEWAIRSSAFEGPFSAVNANSLLAKLRPSGTVSAVRQWLNVHPSRWLLLAAGLFFGSTFVSTLFSGSFTTSVWGEIPGQDGYSAYTIASYGVLFALIATHLKSNAQLVRLLVAVVLMGSLVGLYGTMQHYGHDFLNLTESTGGGADRVTIFMGNTIFAGAVLAMTVPVTIMVAAMSFQNETWADWGPLAKISQLGRDAFSTSLLALILSVQLLGLMFTFSRGPWSGTAFALMMFLGLVALSIGWRMMVRIGLTLGLTGVLLVAFLHWQGSVSIIGIGPWFGFAIALFGLAFTFSLLYVISKFGRAIPMISAIGIMVVIVGAAVLAPSAFSGRGNADLSGAESGTQSTAGQVGERISSIKTEVLGGFVGGRSTHWEVSWKLIKDRPWFAFDNLSFSWLRPLIGYGPDLFRYTYLLESPPDSFAFSPLEPDHAHNFFIHQTVEQGILGGIASITMFASVFGVAVHHVLRKRRTGNPVNRILLLGLTAIILGRFLEMMVGVARISDLTVLWVVFGLFAALVHFDNEPEDAASSAIDQPARIENRRSRRRTARASSASSFSTGLIFRLAIVAWLIGGIGVVTWQKSINSVRAAVTEGRALEHFRHGDYRRTVEELDKAIRLAPGVPSYHNNRAQVFLIYQIQSDLITEQGCNQQREVPYLTCLGVEGLESNLSSIDQQPFYYRSRVAAGITASYLRLNEAAIEFYANAVSLVPNSWRVRVDLAASQIDAGLYDVALVQLETSLDITGDSIESAQAIFQKGRALKGLGRLDEAESTVKDGLSLSYGSASALASLAFLRELNIERGTIQDIEYFDSLLDRDTEDLVATYFRGLAHLRLGNIKRAQIDFENSANLGLAIPEVRANRGYTRLKLDDFAGAKLDLEDAIEKEPHNPLFNSYLAEYHLSRENFDQAFEFLEIARTLNPDFGLAELIQGKMFLLLGSKDSAREVLTASADFELPTALDYIDRAEIFSIFGDSELVIADVDEAIRINPSNPAFFGFRGEAYLLMGEYSKAISDFDALARIDPIAESTLITILKIRAFVGLGQIDEAQISVRRGLSQDYLTVEAELGLQFLRLVQEGQLETLDLARFDQNIKENPEDAIEIYLRGRAHLALGNFESALVDFKQSGSLGLGLPEVRVSRGYAYLKLGIFEDARRDLSQMVHLRPDFALANAYLGEFYASLAEFYPSLGEFYPSRELFDHAFRYLDIADDLGPDLALTDLTRGRMFLSLGMEASAREALDSLEGVQLSTTQEYIDRGTLYASLGEYDLAISDLDQAIQINPNQADYYNILAQMHASRSNFEVAIEDFNTAIELDPTKAEYFINRGVVYELIGQGERSIADFDTARILGEDNIPKPGDRGPSYFAFSDRFAAVPN